MTKTKEVKLVFSDLSKNSYKQWTGQLYDDGRVISYWSAVGGAEQSKDYDCKGEHFFNKKIAEKIKKGYEHAKVVLDVNPQQAFVKDKSLVDVALSQIKFSNKSIENLIVRLVNSNIHKITTATSISYNSSTGLFQTPLGILTVDAIADARAQLLFFLNNYTIDSNYKRKIDSYLKLVPRSKGRKLSYSDIFPNKESIEKELDLLDALENSLSMISSQGLRQAKSEIKEKVFNTKLDILQDTFKRKLIIDNYERTKKSMHNYDNIKVREIYEIDLEYNKNFKDQIGNIQEVYHGSSQANILSCLKSGILIAPPSTAAIAGKLFGNGAYGSQTSSKSIGYTMGRWGQSSGDSGWLFICDFAMGKAHYPNSYGIRTIPSGYDSCWALPKNTGLHNDELIVYNTNQIKMKYLIEIK